MSANESDKPRHNRQSCDLMRSACGSTQGVPEHACENVFLETGKCRIASGQAGRVGRGAANQHDHAVAAPGVEDEHRAQAIGVAQVADGVETVGQALARFVRIMRVAQAAGGELAVGGVVGAILLGGGELARVW